MSEVRTGCSPLWCEPPASGARLVQSKGMWGTNIPICSYCLQQGFGGVFDCAIGFCGQVKKRWQNRRAPRLAGEPNIGSGWIFIYWREERTKWLKRHSSCRENDDWAARTMTAWAIANPLGQLVLFYTINIEEYKNVPIGLALDLPKKEDEHRFSFIKLNMTSR